MQESTHVQAVCALGGDGEHGSRRGLTMAALDTHSKIDLIGFNLKMLARGQKRSLLISAGASEDKEFLLDACRKMSDIGVGVSSNSETALIREFALIYGKGLGLTGHGLQREGPNTGPLRLCNLRHITTLIQRWSFFRTCRFIIRHTHPGRTGLQTHTGLFGSHSKIQIRPCPPTSEGHRININYIYYVIIMTHSN